jgi:hypothetical protein
MRALFVLALVILAVPARVVAQDFRASSVSPPSPGARADIGTFRPYWGAAPERPFVAAVFETAGIAARTELNLGYGKPHHLWAGVEVNSQLAVRGFSQSIAVRATAPFGTMRFGPRFVSMVNQVFVPETDVVTRIMLDADEGKRLRYLALDGEANFAIPLPVGSLGLGLGAYGFFSVPNDQYFLEDNLRVVVGGRFAGRARATYLIGVGDPDTLRIGGLAEVLINPHREMVNVRLGPAIVVSLTHHLEAVGVAALSVFNPDEIGLAGADLGQIGMRYRWATGDLWPEFP